MDTGQIPVALRAFHWQHFRFQTLWTLTLLVACIHTTPAKASGPLFHDSFDGDSLDLTTNWVVLTQFRPSNDLGPTPFSALLND